jgi:hypothetical protein
MSERLFRIILGASLLLLLSMQWHDFIYAYIGIVMFEGITNLRVPILISKARYGSNYNDAVKECGGTEKFSFEAERMLRLLVATFLIVSFVLFNDVLWFFPWFIGVMLLMAGLTNICPMVMGLRWLGLK